MKSIAILIIITITTFFSCTPSDTRTFKNIDIVEIKTEGGEVKVITNTYFYRACDSPKYSINGEYLNLEINGERIFISANGSGFENVTILNRESELIPENQTKKKLPTITTTTFGVVKH